MAQLWLVDSLLIRDLCGWRLPAIVSQALYEPHNRSCKLGSPESTPASRVLQELSLRCGLIHSGFCLGKESPFLGYLSYPVAWSYLRLWSREAAHEETFTLLPPSGMTSSQRQPLPDRSSSPQEVVCPVAEFYCCTPSAYACSVQE